MLNDDAIVAAPSAPRRQAMTDDQSVPISFDEWCRRLNEIASMDPSRYGPDAIAMCGAESWRVYYDGGYTPESAWREDGSYD